MVSSVLLVWRIIKEPRLGIHLPGGHVMCAIYNLPSDASSSIEACHAIYVPRCGIVLFLGCFFSKFAGLSQLLFLCLVLHNRQKAKSEMK